MEAEDTANRILEDETEGQAEEEKKEEPGSTYHADTGGDEYEQYAYPEDDRIELLPLLACTVLVFTVGFVIGRCSRR